MKIQEIRELSAEELNAQVGETRKEIVELRFQLAMRTLESPARLQKAKKKLARLLTIQTEREKGTKEPAAAAS